MKKLFLAIPVLLSVVTYSQENTEPANIFKLNVPSLLLKNFSFQYERALGTKTSLALGLRFQPNGSVPFQEFIKDRIDNPDVLVGEARMGNLAITPEFRYYFKERFRGLYLAPYLRYASFDATAPVTYTGTGTERVARFQGDITSFSAGLLFGNQFQLGSRWVLDWWILGGHIGSSSGQLDFRSPLTPMEQENLQATLDEVDVPFFDIESDIRSDGGTIRAKGAWGGVRAFGLALGFRF